MFGLRSRNGDYRRNEELRSNKEAIRVNADGTATCSDPHLAVWAQRDGFDIVVDLAGKVARKPTGYSPADAAKLLGIIVPTVHKWALNGKLPGYFYRGELIGFATDDIDRIAAERASK